MFLLHDAGAGYTMAVRSSSGRSPLFWGTDEAGDYALFATSPAGRLSAFPQGCAFEVGPGGAPGPQGCSLWDDEVPRAVSGLFSGSRISNALLK